MKITHYKTQAQQNAAWYNKKPIKGISHKKPNNKRTSAPSALTDALKTLATTLVVGALLATIYLSF